MRKREERNSLRQVLRGFLVFLVPRDCRVSECIEERNQFNCSFWKQAQYKSVYFSVAINYYGQLFVYFVILLLNRCVRLRFDLSVNDNKGAHNNPGLTQEPMSRNIQPPY